MARMIPSLLDAGHSPPGEVELFNQFRDHTPEAWTVLHSVDIPQHVRQVEGEIDFLILIPGVAAVCLEVKSHLKVGRSADGLWRLGNDAPTPRSPFRQASEAMHSARKRIAIHQGLSSVPFVSVVVFPRCRFDLPATEWEPWQVIDETDLQSKGLADMVERAGKRHRLKLADVPNAGWFRTTDEEPTRDQCEQIVRILRPTFERSRGPKARRADTDGEMRRYTEEQFEALDALEANPRVVFSGAAGTGKTFVAIEAARRGVQRGDHVLLCCYNRLLGAWMRQDTEPLGPAAEVGTIHSLMLRIAGLQVIENAPASWWSDELPLAAATALLEGHPMAGSFDLVVIDEAQDICTPAYLDVIDLLLRDGLASGRLLAFGDFEHQTIYTGSDARVVLSGRLRAATYTLHTNCRNRPRIGTLASSAFGKGPYRQYRRPDDGVEVTLRPYADDADQIAKLAGLIDLLRSEHYSLGDIAILSSLASGAAHAAIGMPHSGWLAPAANAPAGRIRTSTVHAFKGLEATAVILTDVGDLTTEHSRQLLYVATTRATDRLALLVHQTAVPQLTDLILGGAS
jgi:hypothetical protein